MADLMGENAIKRGPGRPPRAEVEHAERRRRRGSATGISPLDVPQELTDRLRAEGKEGRWINDLGNRMVQKTVHDDWDKVPGVEPVIVGTDKRTNQPIHAYYCSKPAAFLEEDRAKRMDDIREREKAIVRGEDRSELDEGSYQPNTRNRIGDTLS